jgi:secreted trypsin-like serine protease
MFTKSCIAAFCLVLFQGVHLTNGSLAEPTADGQHRGMETRIIGGSVASAQRYPYYTYVKISTEYETSTCGGSLIAPDVVLTAAHCLSLTYDTPTIDAFVNSTSKKYSDNEFYRKGIKMVVHPGYNQSPRDRDIGLIFLDSPVVGVPLVKLNRDAAVPISSNPPSATAIGLGEIGGSEVSDDFFPTWFEDAERLMNVQINPISTVSCIKVYGSARIGEATLCAGGDGEKATCYGDSGGPLLMKGSSAQNDVQIGITAWGPSGCVADGYPDVFTRVSYFAQWIDGQVCKFSKSKPASCTATLKPTSRPAAKPATGRA